MPLIGGTGPATVNTLFLVGKNQGLEMISDLMILLGDGGFFRDNGLNSLPSIRHICSLLNEPDIFSNISYKTVKTSLFVRNSKFWFSGQYSNGLLDANRQKKEVHSPIVGVRSFNTGGKHAVVLEDPKVMELI